MAHCRKGGVTFFYGIIQRCIALEFAIQTLSGEILPIFHLRKVIPSFWTVQACWKEMHWLFPEAFPQTKVMHLSKECKTLWLGSNLFKKMEKHAKVIHFQSKGFLPSKTGNRCNSFPFRRCFLQQCTTHIRHMRSGQFSWGRRTLHLKINPNRPTVHKDYSSFWISFTQPKIP